MEKGKRGRLILTVTGIKSRTIKQGLYERDFWTFDLVSDDGVPYRYEGQRYGFWMKKRYEVVGTCDGFRFGANILKRITVRPEPTEIGSLFEREM